MSHTALNAEVQHHLTMLQREQKLNQVPEMEEEGRNVLARLLAPLKRQPRASIGTSSAVFAGAAPRAMARPAIWPNLGEVVEALPPRK